nr:hypothetical protein SHINE37_10324 [Rhizobiaceae bacterium]
MARRGALLSGGRKPERFITLADPRNLRADEDPARTGGVLSRGTPAAG